MMNEIKREVMDEMYEQVGHKRMPSWASSAIIVLIEKLLPVLIEAILKKIKDKQAKVK